MSPISEIPEIPSSPGIYLMKNEAGEVLYVGKAKNLRKRVTQYFKPSSPLAPKIAVLVEQIAHIDYVVVQNEVEALVLENQFIKSHDPKYNTRLKDSKTYPYLKLDLTEPFPRLIQTRLRKADKALYFGPFVSGYLLSELMGVIREHFHLRRCKKIPKRNIPCLYYHMGRCSGPCIGKITAEDYQVWIKEITMLLEGRYGKLIAAVHEQMNRASDMLNFEKAAQFREQSKAIEQLRDKQRVESLTQDDNLDVFLVMMFDDYVILQVFRVKEGCLVQNYSFDMENTRIDEKEDIMATGVMQFYQEQSDVPRRVIVDHEPEGLRGWLAQRGMKLSLAVPSSAEGQLMDMLRQNAFHVMKRKLITKQGLSYDQVAKKLADDLGLSKNPRRIIGIDISHLGGTQIVASCVSFMDGVPDKDDYRRFNIKTVEYNDDYASIAEVVTRVAKRFTSKQRPDLMLIDGGLGQLHAAMEALRKLDVKGLDILSLAKKEEIVYLPTRPNGVKLDHQHSGLIILQQVRDEAHRFAVQFQRHKRKAIFQ